MLRSHKKKSKQVISHLPGLNWTKVEEKNKIEQFLQFVMKFQMQIFSLFVQTSLKTATSKVISAKNILAREFKDPYLAADLELVKYYNFEIKPLYALIIIKTEKKHSG